MKRGMISWIIILLMILSLGGAWAQSGPSWLIQGNLQSAEKIWDFLEIPNTNIILACGHSSGWSKWADIWKSTNGGQTWSLKLSQYKSSEGFKQFAYDNTKNIVFSCVSFAYNNLNWKSIWYSTDQGDTWVEIYHPTLLGSEAGANSIIFLNNKLYVAYQEVRNENGNNWGIYSAILLRLDVSSYNPSDWYWEFLMQYPELDYLMRLAEKDGKLYVFGKDWNSDAIRIFTYDTQTLNRMATRIGTVEEIRLQVEQYQAQLAQQGNEPSEPDNSSTNANPINEEAEK